MPALSNVYLAGKSETQVAQNLLVFEFSLMNGRQDILGTETDLSGAAQTSQP